MKSRFLIIFLLALSILGACAPATPQTGGLRVLAVESFLADITQNVAGDRLAVDTLIPLGLDPHAFEPTPQDVAKIAGSDVLIVNGAGLESWLAETLANAGGERRVIEASLQLQAGAPSGGIDPHFWLDPILTIEYVKTIRDGLSAADPAGKDIYARNADAYIVQLQELDAWITAKLADISPENRLLVTNHESLGYFAARYNFKIIGAVIPSTSTEASPSAQQMAQLVEAIRSSGAKAIFLEIGSNPDLADQVAQETGVKVITGLYTHSLTPAGGDAPTYIEMMHHDVQLIMDALPCNCSLPSISINTIPDPLTGRRAQP
jgi:ABC-type Zn uptake system ZnuABC Zn-binding protein ZnuA